MQLLSVAGFLMQAIKAINDKIFKDDRCAGSSLVLFKLDSSEE